MKIYVPNYADFSAKVDELLLLYPSNAKLLKVRKFLDHGLPLTNSAIYDLADDASNITPSDDNTIFAVVRIVAGTWDYPNGFSTTYNLVTSIDLTHVVLDVWSISAIDPNTVRDAVIADYQNEGLID